jgi:hypothetical protein
MKTFKEYLAESKKAYPFRVKVAGELPKDFEKKLKEMLGAANPTIIEKSKTSAQAIPLDFPELANMEVYTFEVVCEYPITAPELAVHVGHLVPESNFRVRNGGDPAEAEHATFDLDPSGEAVLDEAEYKNEKIKHKDYFGDDFNKSFLKDLEKTAKARKKEDGVGEYKLPKAKQDKAGSMAPMSKISNPDPLKGKV